jgi:glycosyltransferase involved in cell wall biosynthesis
VIRVVSQPNAGPGAARQAGLDAAAGDFVQFLDSDDRLLPEKFALQVTGLENDPEAGISYGPTYTCVHGARESNPAQRTAEKHRTLFPALLAGRLWETSTPLYRRVALERIGAWPRKRQMEDWEFDAQAGAAGIRLHHCEEYVAEYVIHGSHRLSHAWMNDASAMRDRLHAYDAIAEHARHADVDLAGAEAQRFARTLFAMAREAGAHGHTVEARRLMRRAREFTASTGRRVELALYRGAAAVMGWAAVARLAGLFR